MSAMGPEHHVFFKGAWYRHQSKVKLTDELREPGQTSLWFSVGEHTVRIRITQASATGWAKDFTCTCTQCSLPSKAVQRGEAWQICSHIVAAILFYSEELWERNRNGDIKANKDDVPKL